MKRLTNKQKQTLKQIDELVFNHFKDDASGHSYDHIKRVVDLTTRLLIEKANPFVTLVIAYLHDVFDDKMESQFDSFEELVSSWNLDLDGCDELIKNGVLSIGFKGGFEKVNQSLEATLVSDADYLDSMGAIGIGRAFYYAGSKGTPFHNKNLEGIQVTDYEAYRTVSRNVMTHFDEKLLKLKDYIVSEKGQEIAAKRHQILQDFYDDFHSEIKGAPYEK